MIGDGIGRAGSGTGATVAVGGPVRRSPSKVKEIRRGRAGDDVAEKGREVVDLLAKLREATA